MFYIFNDKKYYVFIQIYHVILAFFGNNLKVKKNTFFYNKIVKKSIKSLQNDLFCHVINFIFNIHYCFKTQCLRII